MNRKIHAIYSLYLLAFLASFAFPALDAPVREYGMLAIAVFPALLIIKQGLLYNRFWKAMAAAHFVWGFSQIVWITNRHHNFFFPPALGDSAYWTFKLLILGAILYRPFYAATEVNRRLYLVDTTVVLSFIAFYLGYFSIAPGLAGDPVPSLFYGTAANVFFNTGIALIAIIVARKARLSGWSQTYRLIALGLTVYTISSLAFLLAGMTYTDPLWCAAFWLLALAVAAAPSRNVKPLDEALTPSRYGLALILIITVSGLQVIGTLFGGASHELQDIRTALTLAEVVALTALIHFRHKIVVEEDELRFHQLEVTLNSIGQPIYIVDGGYNVILANDVFHSRFPSSDGLCYSTVFGRTSPCEWCQLAANRVFSASVESKGSFYQLEFAPLKLTTVRPSEGPPPGGVELLVDVTDERKRQQQHVQTERMASLGRMIAGTAHELNNPLAIVLGNAHLLREHRGLDNEGHRQIAAIASAAERARDIVHNFLSLSRPREGEKTLVNLVEVIRSVEHLKVNELDSLGIEVQLDLPESLTAIGKYTLLQEVFLNLIDNARDAIAETKRAGRIWIRGEQLDADRLRIQVQDNGIGISREHRDQIFDPFFSTKQVGKGTGLGLSLVHSIITDHGGSIEVDSDGHSYTRFDIEFPLVQIAPGAAGLSSQTGRILRILAVDDEPEILTILERSLTRMGHYVECTTTGSRALQLLAKNKFDVVLLDVHLPEMDGKAIMRRLRTISPPVSARTILITGDTMSEETRQFAEDYELPLIMKPVDMEKLSALLQEATLSVER